MNSEYKDQSCNGLFCKLQDSELFWVVSLVFASIMIYFVLRMLFRYLYQRRLEMHKKLEEKENCQTVSKLCISTINHITDKTLPVIENIADGKTELTLTTAPQEYDFKTALAMKLEEYIKETQTKEIKGNKSDFVIDCYGKKSINEDSTNYESHFNYRGKINDGDQIKDDRRDVELEINDKGENNVENSGMGIDTEMFYEDKEEGHDTVRVISDLTSPVFKENMNERLNKVIMSD